MKKRLCIGLISPSSLLLSILDAIGVWYEVIEFGMKSLDRYALVVLGSLNSSKRKKDLAVEFLNTGGSVLEISSNPSLFTDPVSIKFSKTVYNTESSTEFDRVSHLDLYTNCTFSKNGTLFSGLLDFQLTDKNSLVGFLGIDLSSLPKNGRYTRKRFYSYAGSPPDEIVSKLSIDSITDVIELTLQKLFHEQGLPFIKKWSSPEKEPVFGFRIDSDFGTKESVRETYNFIRQHNIKSTWFLHVKAHEDWLDEFRNFKGQEIALHGYKHESSSSVSSVKKNIELGLSNLRNASLDPKGFCAPYGIWNFGLEKALEGFEFEYTSEFTSVHDSVPFAFDSTGNLQIPIHPICTGSLQRKQYSLEEMTSYFLDTYNRKIKLFKPVLFYHHPLQDGLELFGEVFEKAHQDNLTNLTFLEYARFWNQRSSLYFSAEASENALELKSNDPSLLLYVSTSPNEFHLISSKSQIFKTDQKPTFKFEPASLPSLNELEDLQKDQLSLLKTSLVDWRNRNHL